MPRPTFIVIGAFKAGTTSLYHYLRQHPAIFLPSLKETNFFATMGRDPGFRGPGDALVWRRKLAIRSLADYWRLFDEAPAGAAVGEVSPLYLYDPAVPERLRTHLPDVKLVVVLRHPAERAYSNFLHLRRDAREEHARFADALAAEDGRVRRHWEPFWFYTRLGRYHRQLERYYRRFDRARIRVHLFEDFARDPRAVLHDLFRFLDVDPTFEPDVSRRHQISGLPRPLVVHRLITEPGRARTLARAVLPEGPRQRSTALLRDWTRRRMVRPPLAPDLRATLWAGYREDARRLEDLASIDLGAWNA